MKALCPITSNVEGNDNAPVKLLQPSNAPLPISFTPSGIIKEPLRD